MPTGSFPVVLSVARISTDQRVAFATVRFRETPDQQKAKLRA
jgi:hypothetical protein